MRRHVDFLAQLFQLWGVVFAIVGGAGLALAGGALAIARTSGPVATGSELAAGVTAVTMGTLAVLALAWAGLHLWVGSRVRRHEPRARLLAIGLGVANLPLFPFGTGLGAYACWVLLHNEGRHVFEPSTASPPG